MLKKSRPVAGLVLNVKNVDTLNEHKGEWSAVADTVSAIVAGSALGEKLYGFATMSLVSQDLSSKLVEVVKRKLDGDITEATVKKASEECDKVLLAIPDDATEAFEVIRQVAVELLGVAVEVECESMQEQKELVLAAEIKTFAWAAQDDNGIPKLERLFCEAGLRERADPFEHKMDDDVIAPYNVCRTQANSMLAVKKHTSGEDIVELFDDGGDTVAQFDATVKLEASWFKSVYQEGALAALQGKVVPLLPTATVGDDAKVVVLALEDLKKSALFQFAGATSQACVTVTSEVITAISEKRLPTVSGLQALGKFGQTVLASLEFFCVQKPLSGASAPAAYVSLRGKPALAAMFKACEDRVAKK